MSWYQVDDQIKAIKGKALKRVCLSDDKAKITFKFQDGGEQSFGVEGDCCSSSWIEHLTMPDKVDGATILDFKEDEENLGEGEDEDGLGNGKYIMVYQSHFITDRGPITLEYRNSSNGYYGGYLVSA